jgi:hypothetical protein
MTADLQYYTALSAIVTRLELEMTANMFFWGNGVNNDEPSSRKIHQLSDQCPQW